MRFLTITLSMILLVGVAYAENEIVPDDAASHIGEHATVCGVVANAKYATSLRRAPTFLNLDKPYPNHVFTALIWEVDRPKFSYPPETLAGSRICVSGVIKSYQGKPEIIVSQPDQIVIPGKMR